MRVAYESGRCCEDKVAEQHGHVLAPNIAHGSPAPAQRRVIHGVVVDQRRQVKQLHRAGHQHRFFGVVGVEMGGQKRDGRPDPLSPGVCHVVQQGTQVGGFGVGQAQELLLYLLKLGLYRGRR